MHASRLHLLWSSSAGCLCSFEVLYMLHLVLHGGCVQERVGLVVVGLG